MEPVVGRRCWEILIMPGKGYRLAPVMASEVGLNNMFWEPVERAKCVSEIYNHGSIFPATLNNHPQSSPALTCRCGIYAWKPIYDSPKSPLEFWLDIEVHWVHDAGSYHLPGLMERFRKLRIWGQQAAAFERYCLPCCVGEVSLWGKIIEQEFGYRAEYAQVQSIILPVGAPEEVRHDLSTYYECDVTILEEM